MALQNLIVIILLMRVRIVQVAQYNTKCLNYDKVGGTKV